MWYYLWFVFFLLRGAPANAELIWDVDVIPTKDYSSPDIDISLSTPFLFDGASGVIPMQVTIHNKDTMDKMVQVVFQSGKFVVDVDLKANSTEVYEWNLPIFSDNYYIQIVVNVNGEKRFSDSFSMYTQDSNSVLYIANHKLRSKYPEWYAFDRMFSEKITSAHVDNTSLLPTNGYSYSNVESIVWFAENSMDDSQLIAILDWVKLGGNLVVVQENDSIPLLQPWMEDRFRFEGLQALYSAKNMPINGYMSQLDEFRMGEPDKLDSYMNYMLFWDRSVNFPSISSQAIYQDIVTHPSQQELYTSIELRPISTFRVGRGFVHQISGHATLDNIYLLLQQLLFIEHSFHRQVSNINQNSNSEYLRLIASLPDFTMYPTIQSDSIFHPMFIRKLGENWELLQFVSPVVVFLLSCLFLVVLGPLNIYILSKKPKVYFFITTPLLSCTCVLIVLIIGVVQGNSIKGFTSQFVVYDQRSHIMVGSQQRVFFAGREVDDIEIASGNVIFPLSELSRIEVNNKEMSFINYVQNREVQAHIGYHKNTERTGLRFEGDRVFNDFEFDVDYVYYTDATGNVWKGESISANSSEKIIPSSNPAFSQWTNELVVYPMWTSSRMPANSYILQASDAQKMPTFDLVEKELKNREWIIYGVLP